MKREDQIVNTVRQWFIATPDEELQVDDIVAKFGCTKANAYTVIRILRDEGVIEFVSVVRHVSKGRMR